MYRTFHQHESERDDSEDSTLLSPFVVSRWSRDDADDRTPKGRRRLLGGTRGPGRTGRVAVDGDSMLPTLRSGDWLVVRWDVVVAVGDLVVVRRPDRPELLLVKRVARIGADGYLVEGDNPAASDDSRLFGALPATDVLGRVVARYWPNPTGSSSFSRRPH